MHTYIIVDAGAEAREDRADPRHAQDLKRNVIQRSIR